jgi:hypothetical protein
MAPLFVFGHGVKKNDQTRTVLRDTNLFFSFLKSQSLFSHRTVPENKGAIPSVCVIL